MATYRLTRHSLADSVNINKLSLSNVFRRVQQVHESSCINQCAVMQYSVILQATGLSDLTGGSGARLVDDVVKEG